MELNALIPALAVKRSISVVAYWIVPSAGSIEPNSTAALLLALNHCTERCNMNVNAGFAPATMQWCGCCRSFRINRTLILVIWVGRLEVFKQERLKLQPTGGDAFFTANIHMFFPIHTGPLTVTAECLTALHAVCRISAALPGFSRFLVNLRVDSAAISSSERSLRAIQSSNLCNSQSLALAPNMSLMCSVYTHTPRTHGGSHTHSKQSILMTSS